MKAAKWRDLSDDEVRQRVRELAEEVFNLRFQLSMGVAKNPSRMGQARRDLARAVTILRERTPAVTAAAREPSPTVGPVTAERDPAPAVGRRRPPTARKKG